MRKGCSRARPMHNASTPTINAQTRDSQQGQTRSQQGAQQRPQRPADRHRMLRSTAARESRMSNGQINPHPQTHENAALHELRNTNARPPKPRRHQPEIQHNQTRASSNPGRTTTISSSRLEASELRSDPCSASTATPTPPIQQAVKRTHARRRRDVSPTSADVHLTPRTDGVAVQIAGSGRNNA